MHHTTYSVPHGATVLLTSDWHLGAAGCDVPRIEADLARCDYLALAGDVLDAILPGDAKRYSADAVHPRCRVSDSLGAALSWAGDILFPHRHKILFISQGNHETSVLKRHHLDLIASLAKTLDVPYLPYAGIAKINHLTLGYWHGHGGGSTLATAIRQCQKLADTVEGLDIAWTGHRHQRYISPTMKFTARGKLRKCWLAMSGAYLKWSNYAMEAMMRPADIGGILIHLSDKTHNLSVT